MFAIIKTGGKQYKVAEGQKIKIEKLPVAASNAAETASDAIVFDQVLMVSNGDSLTLGQPQVSGAKVTAKVIKNGRARKIIILKYRAKKRYKKKAGHRQHFTEVEITQISA